jgi:hypothetical protein
VTPSSLAQSRPSLQVTEGLLEHGLEFGQVPGHFRVEKTAGRVCAVDRGAILERLPELQL